MDRVDRAVAELEDVHRQLLSTVAAAGESAWREVTTDEGWPLGVTVRHIAYGYLMGRQWLETIGRGQAVTMRIDDIHAANSGNREAQPDPKEQTAAFLEKAFGRLVDTIRNGGDRLLDSRQYFGVVDREVSGEDVVRLQAGHARGHLRSVQETLKAAPARG